MGRRFIGLSAVDRALLPRGCGDCVFWETAGQLPRHCPARSDDAEAGAWIRRVATEWGECGRVVMSDGEVLGFIKYAPPWYLPQSLHMPPGPPDPDVVLIACLHLSDDARQTGVGGVLLRAALRDLAGRGERSVQAYATTSRDDFAASPVVGIDFLLRHGFTVHRPHPQVPLLRLDLKSLVSWTENLESVLDSLRLPLRVPNRAPATLAVRRGER